MKPLVYWCRWQEARLQLRGRDETAVWGSLVYNDSRTESFHFDLDSRQLTLDPTNQPHRLQLDEMGVVVN
jgi:hypothetical protein